MVGIDSMLVENNRSVTSRSANYFFILLVLSPACVLDSSFSCMMKQTELEVCALLLEYKVEDLVSLLLPLFPHSTSLPLFLTPCLRTLKVLLLCPQLSYLCLKADTLLLVSKGPHFQEVMSPGASFFS